MGKTLTFNNWIEEEIFIFYRIGKSVGGVMVSMVAFQAVDPGSIPGRRTFFGNFFFDRTTHWVFVNQ